MAKIRPGSTLSHRQLKWGFTILALGVFTALFFRRDNTTSVAYDTSNLERRISSSQSSSSHLPVVQDVPRLESFKVPTVATGIGGDSRVDSDFPPTYHRTLSPVGALLKPITDDGPEPPAIEPDDHTASASTTEEMHTIVDGDTLASLAEHYLGSNARQMEIYELNKDVLSSPDLLPIGKTLRIPPRQKPAAPAAARATLPASGSARARPASLMPMR